MLIAQFTSLSSNRSCFSVFAGLSFFSIIPASAPRDIISKAIPARHLFSGFRHDLSILIPLAIRYYLHRNHSTSLSISTTSLLCHRNPRRFGPKCSLKSPTWLTKLLLTLHSYSSYQPLPSHTCSSHNGAPYHRPAWLVYCSPPTYFHAYRTRPTHLKPA